MKKGSVDILTSSCVNVLWERSGSSFLGHYQLLVPLPAFFRHSERFQVYCVDIFNGPALAMRIKEYPVRELERGRKKDHEWKRFNVIKYLGGGRERLLIS